MRPGSASATLTPRETPAPVHIPRFGVFAVTSRHGRRFRMPFETRAFDKLAFVSAGAGALDLDDREVALTAGDLVHVPPHARHRFRDAPGAPMTLHLVCIDWAKFSPGPEAQQVFRTLVRRLRPLQHVAGTYTRAEIIRRVRAMVLEQTRRRPGHALAAQAAVVALLVTLMRARAEPRPARAGPEARLAGTLAYIEDHFAEPVRIPALAAMAGMSYRAYTDQFRRAVGRTVAQHLASLRVAYAEARLAAGVSIVDAAMDAGFEDVSSFYRLFRRVTGMTPGRVRAGVQGAAARGEERPDKMAVNRSGRPGSRSSAG